MWIWMDVNGDMDADVDVDTDVGLLHRLFHNRNSGFGHTSGESESGLPPDHRGAPAGIQLSAQAARRRRAFCRSDVVGKQGASISAFLDTLLPLVIWQRLLLAFE
jgi:hypothetical protein